MEIKIYIKKKHLLKAEKLHINYERPENLHINCEYFV